jgi:Tol biopolymer transport system component
MLSWISRPFVKTTRPVRRGSRGARPATWPVRLGLETLEDRTLLSAVLPISVASSGSTMGNALANTAPGSVSTNGQYDVFVSAATDLVAGATIQPFSGNNVYLRNLTTGTTSLVDVDLQTKTESGNAGADLPSITPDGRYVAFVSRSTDLTSNDANASAQEVYVRDMATSQTFLVSHGYDGNPANAGGYADLTPSIAENGKGQLLIAYQSNATNLVKADTNGNQEQIFLATLNLSSGGSIKYGSLSTKLVSATSGGNGAGTGVGQGGDSLSPVLSRDGSTLAFNSFATNLNIPGGYNDNDPDIENLYLYSVASSTLSLISAEPTTTTAATSNQASDLGMNKSEFGTTASESLSSNGQYQVFTSNSDNLVPGLASYQGGNVYLRNLTTGTTSLVSVNDTGTAAGNLGSDQPVITLDGRYVAFLSEATDITSLGGPGLFVRDMQQGQTYYVSLGIDGNPANAQVFNPSIAETTGGQLVIAYRSAATNLTAGDTTSNTDEVFVTTFQLDATGQIQYNTLATKLVSADSSGNGGNNNSDGAILSKDGSTLAFESRATNLPGETPDVANGLDYIQVFTYNIASGTLTQVSPIPATGTVADSTNLESISDNGQYLAYDYSNNTTGVGQTLAWNATTKTNTVIWDDTGTGRFPTDVLISGDGSTVVFGEGDAYGRNWLYTAANWQLGQPAPTLIAGSPNSLPAVDVPSQPSISDNGTVIAYQWSDAFGDNQIYVDDNGTTIVATPATTSPGNGGQLPVVSGDGSTVAFDYNLAASTLVPNTTDFVVGQDKVFSFNVPGQALSLVSAKAPGLFTADDHVHASSSNSAGTTSTSLSSNGRYLAFESGANDLLGNLPVDPGSVFAEDVQAGLPVVISTGSFAYNSEPVISGDGSTLVFQSGSLLTANDVSGGIQLFTATSWQGGSPTFTLVSVDSAGTDAGNRPAEYPSISDNGLVVAFDSYANNLVSNDPDANQYTEIFVRNLATNTTTLVSSNSAGTDGGDNISTTALVSGDGSTVFYNSQATDLVASVSVPSGPFGPLTPDVYGYAASANHIVVSAPLVAVAGGKSVTITLTAETVVGGIDSTYNGTATLQSSDPNAVLPTSVTFVNGVATATVTFETAGKRTVTVTDTSNPDLQGVSGAVLVFTNITSDLNVVGGGFTFNSTTKEYAQTVTITNTSQLTFTNAIYLALNNLSSNATLANAQGTFKGKPGLAIPVPSGGLAPGQSVTVTLYFKDPKGTAITYTTEEGTL